MPRQWDSAVGSLIGQQPTRTTFVCDLATPTPRSFTNYRAADGSGIKIPTLLSALTITSGGSGYTAAPTVSFSGGGGQGAAALAIVTGGVVTALVITSRGWGYTSAPSVSFAAAAGSGAAATATIGPTFAYAPADFAPLIESADGSSVIAGNLILINTDNAFTDLVNNAANLRAPFSIQRVWRNSSDQVSGTEIWLEGFTGKPSFAGETVTIVCAADMGRRGQSPRVLWNEVMTGHLPPAAGTKYLY